MTKASKSLPKRCSKAGAKLVQQAPRIEKLGRSAITGQFVLKPASTGGSLSPSQIRRAIQSIEVAERG